MLQLHPLTGALFGDGPAECDPLVLVVFLHGDVSSGGPADYMYYSAREVAQRYYVITAAILRPGYWDAYGRKSCGSNNRRRDHYTQENNDLVRVTIQNLKIDTGAQAVVVVGHSGGAEQLGVIIAQSRDLVNNAILAAVAGDIEKWRKLKGSAPWPNSLSPSDFADRVDPGTVVDALTGSLDDNTPPNLADEYIRKLREHDIDANFAIVEGGHHGFNSVQSDVLGTIFARLGQLGAKQ